MMHWVWTILIGFVAGLIATAITPGTGPTGFLLTALLGVVFLGGQAVEYTSLFREGQSMAKPFGTAFFTLTGIHGLHVFVGVIWCMITWAVARRGTFSSNNFTTVEIFGLYWHFVDLIWVIIFTVVYLTN